MKKYIEKPKEPTVCDAIKINYENKDLIEKTFSKDVLLGFFYHNEDHFEKDTKSEEFDKLGCHLFIHDANCRAFEGDYIIINKYGHC